MWITQRTKFGAVTFSAAGGLLAGFFLFCLAGFLLTNKFWVVAPFLLLAAVLHYRAFTRHRDQHTDAFDEDCRHCRGDLAQAEEQHRIEQATATVREFRQGDSRR